MASTLETFSANRDKAKVTGQARGIELVRYEHDREILDLSRSDGRMIADLQKLYPEEHPTITLDAAHAMVPTIFSNREILEQVLVHAGRSDNPDRISTVGLQLGAYAVHLLHTLEWGGYQVPIVSYIPRGDDQSIFSKQARNDIDLLPIFGKMFRQIPHGIREHTDVNVPIATGSVTWEGKSYPVYLTPFDDTRGEISVESMGYKDEKSQEIHMVPVPTYSVPLTQDMAYANDMQLSMREMFRSEEKRELAYKIVWRQLICIAESHAVFAQVTGHLPRYMSMDAGDWMGILDPYKLNGDGSVGFSIPTNLKLMTIKGKIFPIASEKDWTIVMESYTYSHKVKKPVFGLLNRDHLHFAWDNAQKLLG